MLNYYCKTCFKGLNGSFIPDCSLLMSKEDAVCDNCRAEEPVVLYYFKYGEQKVTSDGKRFVDRSKHVGVTPNYSFFGNTSLYPEE